jgi:hypothetical protein
MLGVIMLGVIMLGVIMLGVIMLGVIMLNAIMMNVMAQFKVVFAKVKKLQEKYRIKNCFKHNYLLQFSKISDFMKLLSN